jgi:hypothetical protein
MLHAIFFLITGTVSLNVLDKHYQNMGGYTSAEQRASFPTFFSRTIQLLRKKKLIEYATSRFTVLNTIHSCTGGGMSKGRRVTYISGTLCKVNRQPISASENGDNFLDQLKGEIFCVRTDTNIESFGKGTMIFI